MGILLFVVGFLVVMAAAMWRVFEKAGHEGWEALIPFYNMYILVKIVEKPGYWAFLMCIPYVGLVFSIWTWNLLVKKFGKSEGFTVGIIFLPFVFIPILGFGDAQFEGSVEDKFLRNTDLLDAI
jgi:Family of unknown function (DUF5684)